MTVSISFSYAYRCLMYWAGAVASYTFLFLVLGAKQLTMLHFLEIFTSHAKGF